MSSLARDRRAPLFGASSAPQAVDPESLEKENDRDIAALGDRVGMLRNITSGIHAEVEEHHTVLDNMSMSMSGIQLGLRASANKFKQVMNGPQGRSYILYGGVLAVVLFIMYLWYR
ncbi:BET1 [Auxenochlorella protothecoides x Auxenochlorella symbiontica]